MNDLLDRLKSALAERYAVEREIGRGGMATVFLAEDLRHDRKVAIKVLHPELTATLGAERFLSEIKIVARLQHPHILPLYDSGEVDGLLYYVMPYARGESLRQRLDREAHLAVDESIRIAVEVADGLDYAHREGVIHRDIKPGNILLAEGHATIADFGIARAIQAARADRVTSTGLGVGTPLYASPEQATAQETLDGRTDIYSLACVLYEMLAGEPPLTGATPEMIQARRLSETPTALHSMRDTVPPALDQAIAHALARIPADRHATAAEFGQALQAVLLGVAPLARAEATPAGKTVTRRLWRIGVPAALVAALIVIVLLVSDAWPGRATLQVITSNIIRITNNPGLEFQPSISPDGNEVAYVEGPIGKARIVVRSTIDTRSGGESRPGAELSGRHLYPSWTPDGASLRFQTCPFGGTGLGGCEWKEVGSRGGSGQTIDAPGGSAWSPDGRRVAFSVYDSIFVYSVEQDEVESLAAHPQWKMPLHSFAWSPDGRRIAYVHGNFTWRTSTNVLGVAIWVLEAEGGTPIRVTDDEHLHVSPQWLPDNRHLLFVSDRDGARGIHVLEVGPDGPRGTPRPVPSSSDPHSISISGDGRRLAYSNLTVKQNIWSIAIPASGPASIADAVPVTTGHQIIETHSLSPDGEWLAFDTDIQGEQDIYKQPLAGGISQAIVDVAGDAFGPDWSSDGTEIVFMVDPKEAGSEFDIFVVSTDGGRSRRLTEYQGYDGSPDWSPDGLAIVYNRPGARYVTWGAWRISRDGLDDPWGDPVQLTEFGCLNPDWAPDGASFVCNDAEGRLALVSRDGEVLWRYAPPPLDAGIQWRMVPRFSPDGARIYFAATHEDGSDGVWWIKPEGGEATKVVTFDDPTRTMFGWLSVGREHLYLTITEYESDIRVMDLEW